MPLTLKPKPKQPPKQVNVLGLTKVQNPGQRFSRVLGSDPYVIARALRLANEGDNEQYQTLAHEMQERYLHFASVIQTRIFGVLGENREVKPGEDSDLGRQIADEFQSRVVDKPEFNALEQYLMDAIPKGYSVVQPAMDYSSTGWDYKEFQHIDSRLFTFDQVEFKQLRLRQEGTPGGIEIPEGWIVHKPSIRTGLPIRAGLARLAAVAYMFHAAGAKQLGAVIDVYGMPTRWAEYNSSATTQDEQQEMLLALSQIGTEAAGLVPDTMKLHVESGLRDVKGDVFEFFLNYWDKQISKVVLGQTMSTDDGSSEAQAKIHNEVRIAIVKADARMLEATLRQQVAAPWVLYNFGPNAPVPHVKYDVEPPEDVEKLTTAAVALINSGVRLAADEVRERLGFRKPEPGEEVIEPAQVQQVTKKGAAPNGQQQN